MREEVHFPGPPVFDKGHEEKDVAVGDSVILSCKVDEKGSGNVDVSWVYNGNPVENGQLSDSIEVSRVIVKIRFAYLTLKKPRYYRSNAKFDRIHTLKGYIRKKVVLKFASFFLYFSSPFSYYLWKNVVKMK